jgi:hypothetical protein
VSPLRIFFLLASTFVPIFRDGAWEVLTTPGNPAYHPLWAPLILFELIGNVGFIVAQVVALFLYFRRSRWFPRLYLAIVITSVPFVFLDAWLVTFVLPGQPMLDPGTAAELARSLAALLIWGPYMLLSKRVKNTFVE